MIRVKPKKQTFQAKTREEADTIYEDLKHAQMFYNIKWGFMIFGFKRIQMTYHDYTLVKSK